MHLSDSSHLYKIYATERKDVLKDNSTYLFDKEFREIVILLGH
jgi:hypothetical protein